tara:strand:- start:1852 stop:3279 length:1428 start_codon:yes stop_codon:yes gene_type:complete
VVQSNKVRVRFAPSPTGELHLGSARTALFNYLFAKNNKGKFLLRIEDTDHERSHKAHVEQAISSIKWLGFAADEGIVFQSNRSNIYKKYLNRLLENGTAYRCFASKEELKNIRIKTNSYSYSGLWRDRSDEDINEQLEKGHPYTIRLKTPNKGHARFKDLIYGEIKISNKEIDDFIISRSDGSPVYNFTNVIDDHLMKISHVIRGEDHISNTPKQLHIYRSLGFKTPLFAHLPMILGEDKKKLSKRHGAESVESYRNSGFQSAPLINYLALLGWNPGDNEEIIDLQNLISKFDVRKVQKKSAVFDPKKFNWISAHYLQKEEAQSIFTKIRSSDSDWGISCKDTFCLRVIELMKPRADTIKEIMLKSHYFFNGPKIFNDNDQKKVWKESTEKVLENIVQFLEKIEDVNRQNLENIIKSYIETCGFGFGEVLKPMRLAMCGSLTGPSLFDLIELVGIKESISRINYYIYISKHKYEK